MLLLVPVFLCSTNREQLPAKLSLPVRPLPISFRPEVAPRGSGRQRRSIGGQVECSVAAISKISALSLRLGHVHTCRLGPRSRTAGVVTTCTHIAGLGPCAASTGERLPVNSARLSSPHCHPPRFLMLQLWRCRQNYRRQGAGGRGRQSGQARARVGRRSEVALAKV
jgi:hypothetical protein